MSSVISVWGFPLGQTPSHLDPQSQEAAHEVNVSGMDLQFSSARHQGESLRSLEEEVALKM